MSSPALTPTLVVPSRTYQITRYVPHTPTPHQIAFLLTTQREVLYGGAAGGGKSDALLMGALQWVEYPGYNAILLRRSFAELSKPGALMDRAAAWLRNSDARWNDETHTWTFPSNATLSFGYAERDNDIFQYDSTDYQYIGWDELTTFKTDVPYRYMFSRLRRLKDTPVPTRVRAATNPGGPGHEWVKARFFGPAARAAGRIFIAAKKEDNPYLDVEDYNKSLAELDAVTYAQKAEGNWEVAPTGDLFDVDRLVRLPAVPQGGVLGRIRYWDKAGTAGGTGAYTAGVRMARLASGLYAVEYAVEDVIRGRWGAAERNRIIRQTAGLVRDGETVTHPADPPGTVVWFEQEPGSGGKESAEISVKDLAGVEAYKETVTGDKASRARQLASQVGVGNVGIVAAEWNVAYKDELRAAPNGVYWDQIDGSSGGFNKLALLSAPLAATATPAPVLRLPWGVRTD